MKVWGLNETEIRTCISAVSKLCYKNNLIIDEYGSTPKKVGHAFQFKLKVKSSKEPGHTITHSGKRWVSACWHCHRDVYIAIFAINPDARIKTAIADYRGEIDFNWKYENTGYYNVGSQAKPKSLKGSCECE